MKELEYKNSKVALPVETNHKKVVRTGLVILGLVFGVLGGWMALAPLSSAAVAVGQVKVESNTKTIQHLEGGIVEDIHVKDGHSVKEGDLLIEIKNVRLKSELEILESEFREAKVFESRLIAERDDKNEIEFPQEILEIKDEIGDIIDGQISVFHTRRNLRLDEKQIMEKRIEQLKRQIQGIDSVIESRKQHVESISEEIKEWERLVKEQLSDKIKLRDLKKQKINIEGEIASQKADISRLEVQITETQTQQLLQEKSFKEEVLSQLQEVQQKLNDLRARRLALVDQLERTKIKSPVDGTVVGLSVHTIGGVIAPGKPIMTIVPKQSDLIIEAKMQTTDIDNVHTGLLADVRFSAFKQQMVHVVEGEVVNVSADALVDEQSGNPYYQVDVKVTPKGFLQLSENKFFLLPGMPAEVLIKTGERTVLSYLLNPFTNMLSRAFKED